MLYLDNRCPQVIETLEKFVDAIIDGTIFVNMQEALPIVIDHCLDLEQT